MSDMGSQPDIKPSPPHDHSRCHLDRPRIHFAGRFRADVSTINNCYDNFDTDNFKVIDGVITDPEHASWNPTGTGVFNFHRVAVTSVCPEDGPCTTNDPLVTQNVFVDTVLSGGSGKIVDLDVEFQTSSLLYGVKFGIAVHDHEHGLENRHAILIGSFLPVGFKSIWRFSSGGSGDSPFSATYQSVLTNLTWNDERLQQVYPPGSSNYKHSLLKSLQRLSPHELSISFTVYGMNTDPESPHFTYGYVVGTIGARKNPRQTPVQYVRGRLLNPPSTDQWLLNRAEFLVRSRDNQKTVTIDFSNSLTFYFNSTTRRYQLDTDAMGSRLCVKLENGDILGQYELSDKNYLQSAGIFEIDLTNRIDDFVKLQSVLLQVVNCSDRTTVFLAESLYYVRPMGEIFSFMDPGDNKMATFFVTQYGRPVQGYEIKIGIDTNHNSVACSDLDSSERGSKKRCECTRNMTADETERALQGLKVNGESEYSAFTDEHGEATVYLEAGDPGRIRKYVDGMVYLVTYLPSDSFGQNYPDASLVIRVFDVFSWEGEPVWYGQNGVHPILKQYENLYPSMRNFVNLGDYDSMIAGFNINHMRASMSSPKTAAGHMPVTRDLSKNRTEMILQWLNQPFPPTKGRKDFLTLEELRYALQLALQVEFYTIPTYAYALYSIKEGANRQIASHILSVLVEEMGHLAIVANILNAIGGRPRIFDRDFIPVYPSRLPGGIEPSLVLRLAPLSIDLVRDVFMEIETPTRTAIDSDDDDVHNDTIGAFYKRVLVNLVRLETESQKNNETIFTGDPSRQVDYIASPVHNLTDARQGIRLIVTQGEGTSQLNPTTSRDELAHYYKFAEIVHGQELFKKPNGNWDYVGPVVPFDPNGIWPLAVNPKVTDYPAGSRARMLAEDFSRLYLQTLLQMQTSFDGDPKELPVAVANMFLLKFKARELVKVEVKPGVHAGPTFENPLRLGIHI